MKLWQLVTLGTGVSLLAGLMVGLFVYALVLMASAT